MDPLVIVVPDPSLVVLVGAAGAGKSTFAARHFAPGEVLSSDVFRALVSGDAADQRATRPAFAALHRSLGRRLAAGQLTVVDATSLTAYARRGLLARAAAARVPAVAIVLDLPADLVRARNLARDGSAAIPDAAVLAQLGDLSRTIERERETGWPGFAAVHRLSAAEDVDRVLVRREPARPR
ncbi:MAG TPA: AAA family ATPase [Candidatus Limnocylindrales bacterium]|jgi:protein phosphatase